jgi:hypothetical protein
MAEDIHENRFYISLQIHHCEMVKKQIESSMQTKTNKVKCTKLFHFLISKTLFYIHYNIPNGSSKAT